MTAATSDPGPLFPESEDYICRHMVASLAWTDWTAFADALRRALPRARYFYEPAVMFCCFPVPPPLFHSRRMLDFDGLDPRRLPTSSMHFDHAWEPEWRWLDRSREPELGEGGYWCVRQPRLPAFRFELSYAPEPEAGRPEHLTDGSFWFFFTPGNRKHLALGRQVLGLFRKVAVRAPQVWLRGPQHEEMRICPRMGPYWLGRDAIQWARRSPQRLLAYRHYRRPEDSWGVRPLG